MISNSEFADWKRNPVTQQIFRQLRESENDHMQELVALGGERPLRASLLAGYINALRDFYLINIDEPLEEIQAQ